MKEVLKVLQDNYEIETVQDLRRITKDLFKEILEKIMNTEVNTTKGTYSKGGKTTTKR